MERERNESLTVRLLHMIWKVGIVTFIVTCQKPMFNNWIYNQREIPLVQFVQKVTVE